MSKYPSAAEINALPLPLRDYIHDLETGCDPAGVLMELALTKDHVAALEVAIQQTRAKAFDDAARAECEMCAANMELVEGTDPVLVWKDGAWVDGGRQPTFHHRIPDMGGLWACLARKIRALDAQGHVGDSLRVPQDATSGVSKIFGAMPDLPDPSAEPDRAFLGGDKWGASSGGKPCGHHETNPCGCPDPSTVMTVTCATCGAPVVPGTEALHVCKPTRTAPRYVCPMKRPSGEPKNCGECKRNGRNEPGECYCCGAKLIPSTAPTTSKEPKP